MSKATQVNIVVAVFYVLLFVVAARVAIYDKAGWARGFAGLLILYGGVMVALALGWHRDS